MTEATRPYPRMIHEALDAPILREFQHLLPQAEVLDERVQPEFERVDALEADAGYRL